MRSALENSVIMILHHLSIPDGVDHVGLDRPTPHCKQVGRIQRCGFRGVVSEEGERAKKREVNKLLRTESKLQGCD